MLLAEINKTGLTDDAAIVAYFNTPSIPSKGSIKTADIKQYLIMRDLRVAIKNSASIPCQTVMLTLADFETFDCSNPLILAKLTQVLDELIADGLVPNFVADDKAYVLSLADALITPAESLALVVTPETVHEVIGAQNVYV